MFSSIAHAMGVGGGAAATGDSGSFITTLIPFILMFAIFYFLLIRPQQKKNKEQREMISSLQKGVFVVTTGGVYGKITGLDENTVTLEISDKVRIKLNRGNIATVVKNIPKAQPNKNKK